ncbi:MAG: solute-binding protein [Acaryochloris sp. RU_4_1]|nr:solute-binding protein [Acaryochloris sp. RU_4_1]NJR56434.1 solute-binding protein [Acaryochloris sp. CRU_2_0]
MLPVKSTSMSTFAMLVTLGLSSPVFLTKVQLANAQTQSSPAPKTLKIDNLTRMAPINQVLKSGYEGQSPDITIQIRSQSPDSTLESLQNKEADLAAISRLLTPEEKAQGMIQTPITREKIAIVVGKDNPLAQELTIDQVVKIFQGEITDWSELGGKPGSIRVIHRPLANNLQSTLQTYDLFKQATFNASENTIQLDKDNVEALVAELGTDGISYALASQILNAEGIRPVSMYKTLPDDPRYPFSQPFTYVHQGTPNAATQAFLDFAASEEGEQAIAQAKTQPPLASDQDSGNPTSSTDPKPTDDPSISTPLPNSSTATSNPTEPGTNTQGETQNGNNGLGWLPIGLLSLVLGGGAVGILAALSKKRQQPQAPPRPAPNYAEKIGSTRLQTTTTQLQESPASPVVAPIPEGTESPPFPEEESPLSSSDIALGATTLGVTATGLAANLPHPTSTPIEDESQISERVDITSKELEAQTRIQNPKTELQDTLPSLREPETQWQDPGAIPIPDPGQTWIQEEPFPQDVDSGTTQLQDPHTTQLQDSGTTQLQDPSTTQLQDPSITQLQDPRQTWIQEEEFPQDFDPGTTSIQESDTQLQDRDIS